MLTSRLNLVIWNDIKCNRYYYKITRNFYKRYHVGDYNQYGHEVVLIIPIIDIKKYIKERN